MDTPYGNSGNEILEKKAFKAKYLSNYINLSIEKTKNNVIIRSSYYEIKLTKDNLSSLTKIIYKSTDELFEFIKNIFNQNKYRIKKVSSKEIILILIIYDVIKGKEKEIEIFLLENFENSNYLFKELFSKYSFIEKELYNIKNNNEQLMEENNKLKNDNKNLKIEIESIKNNHINDIGNINMNIMNIYNQLQQQINQYMQQINNIQQQINNIQQQRNIGIMGQMNNFNLMNQNDFILMNQNNLNLMNQNDINPMKQNNLNMINFNNYNQINQNYLNSIENQNNSNTMNNIEQNSITVTFIKSGDNWTERVPIMINCNKNELVSTLIEKFRIKANYQEKNIFFFYNAKKLCYNLTLNELEISNNSYIFIVKKSGIIFKIKSDYFFKISFQSSDKLLSDLINEFLNESCFTRLDIIEFTYNGKILNENISMEEANIKDNCEILVKTRKKLKYNIILFKCSNILDKNYHEPIKIKYRLTDKLIHLIERYEIKTNSSDLFFRAYLNSKEIYNNSSKTGYEDKKLSELGFQDNSIIMIDYKFKN